MRSEKKRQDLLRKLQAWRWGEKGGPKGRRKGSRACGNGQDGKRTKMESKKKGMLIEGVIIANEVTRNPHR